MRSPRWRVDLGQQTISLTGSQAGIVTDTVHGKAKIVEVRASASTTRSTRIAYSRRRVQGCRTSRSTSRALGRGGTDLTAVARGGARRLVRDLHRRAGGSPAIRGSSPGAEIHAVATTDARDGGFRRENFPATLGRFARNHNEAPRPLHICVRTARGSRRRKTFARRGDDLRRVHTRENNVPRWGRRAASLFGALALASVNVDTTCRSALTRSCSPRRSKIASTSSARSIAGADWSSRDDPR